MSNNILIYWYIYLLTKYNDNLSICVNEFLKKKITYVFCDFIITFNLHQAITINKDQ